MANRNGLFRSRIWSNRFVKFGIRRIGSGTVSNPLNNGLERFFIEWIGINRFQFRFKNFGFWIRTGFFIKFNFFVRHLSILFPDLSSLSPSSSDQSEPWGCHRWSLAWACSTLRHFRSFSRWCRRSSAPPSPSLTFLRCEASTWATPSSRMPTNSKAVPIRFASLVVAKMLFLYMPALLAAVAILAVLRLVAFLVVLVLLLYFFKRDFEVRFLNWSIYYRFKWIKLILKFKFWN